MDIYLGSNQIIQEHLLNRSNAIIRSINNRYKGQNYGKIILWKDQINPGQSFVFNDERYIIVFDGYLHNIEGTLPQQLPIIADRISNKKPLLQGDETGIFNISVVDRQSNKIYLACDPSALIPLYYSSSKDTFFFFSHEYIFANALNLKPDPVGVLTKLKYGYTFGSRTLYKSLFRINPGEIIEFQNLEKRIRIHKNETYYIDYKEFGDDLGRVAWDCLNLPFKSLPGETKKIGLMLSEGFDSRLVAGLANQAGLGISAYTHGTSGTNGAGISFDVANHLSAEYFFNPLNSGLPSEEQEIKKQLYLADNLSIPYWIYASDYFSGKGVDLVTTGYALDSTLGGHQFYRPKRPRTKAIIQRYSEIIRQDVGSLGDAYVENLSDALLANFRATCLSAKSGLISRNINEDLAANLVPFLDSIVDDFDQEINRLITTGSQFSSQVLQRFLMENRARKYSFGQELTLRIKNKLVTPSYEPVAMRVLTSIHPKYKIQHQLYLSITRKELSELFKIPIGGYGLPIQYPRVILETSRFLHKLYEERFNKRYLKTKGKVDINHLRPVNYIESTCRKGDAIETMINWVGKNEEIFNKQDIVKNLKNVRDFNCKSFALLESYRLIELVDPLSGI